MLISKFPIYNRSDKGLLIFVLKDCGWCRVEGGYRSGLHFKNNSGTAGSSAYNTESWKLSSKPSEALAKMLVPGPHLRCFESKQLGVHWKDWALPCERKTKGFSLSEEKIFLCCIIQNYPKIILTFCLLYKVNNACSYGNNDNLWNTGDRESWPAT